MTGINCILAGGDMAFDALFDMVEVKRKVAGDAGAAAALKRSCTGGDVSSSDADE
jgi:hypothetical protein